MSKLDDARIGSSPELDDPPSEQELAEAESLARALDRGVSQVSAPEEALVAAALLRLQSHGELSPERGRAIFEELLNAPEASPRQQIPERRNGWFSWIVPAFGVAGLAVLLLVLRPSEEGPSATAPFAQALKPEWLPRPSRALIEAQLSALTTQEEDAQRRFEQQMGQYRAQVFASLEEHHRR